MSDFSIVQGLFERHKIVVATQLTMAILKKEDKLPEGRFELMMSPPRRVPMQSPLPDWLPDNIWSAANALKVIYYPYLIYALSISHLYLVYL